MRAVIGTAGHVDHGKTTLIGQLTGIETDRLVEEKARGISIELGFAWLDLGDGGRAAIIDVPGHERFVRQMIAGAAGIDLVLLVVAADEGVMPQTREHLDICQLLGVGAGAIVITKTDLVDAEWLELVEDDVREAVAGTFLADAPLVACAAGDPASVARVAAAVSTLVGAAEARGDLTTRSADRPFKLSVDRTFTMRGFGTVVTGTTAAGTLAVGEPVVLRPSGLAGRVRGLQMHGEPVETLEPGVRAAINLQGIDQAGVHRGDVLTRPGELEETSMIDATLTTLGRLTDPLKDRAKVLLHVGTAQVEATVALLGCEAVSPGESACVQLRLAHPTAFLPGERYVIRGFTVLEGYGKTVGGGRALVAQSRRHRRHDGAALETIHALAGSEVGAGVTAFVTAAGEAGCDPEMLGQQLPFARGAIAEALTERGHIGALITAGARVYGRRVVEGLTERMIAVLADYHAAHPARRGLRLDEIRSRIRGTLDGALADAAVTVGVTQQTLQRAGDTVALASFAAFRSEAQEACYEAVSAAIVAGAFMPPRVQDLSELLGVASERVDEAITFLIGDGLATRVSRDLVYATDALQQLEGAMRTHFATEETLDTPTFKQLTGASRKFTIPLGEYFDKVRLTVRVGDVRRLRKKRRD